MSKLLNQFRELYKDCISHLVFIWLVFFVSGIIILGISFLAQKIKSETDQKLSHSPLVLYFSSSLDSIQIVSEFEKIDLIENIEYKSAGENISEMTEKFYLEGLENWVSKNELNDILILYFSAEKFSIDEFQEFITEISEDERFESIDFDAEKIVLYGRIKGLGEKYKFYLLASIVFISLISLSFIRFFMRCFQKEKWKLWKSEELRHYKFQHFAMELVILIFALFISFGMTLVLTQDKLQAIFREKVFSFHSEYFAIFYLFGGYIIISLINLISRKDG